MASEVPVRITADTSEFEAALSWSNLVEHTSNATFDLKEPTLLDLADRAAHAQWLSRQCGALRPGGGRIQPSGSRRSDRGRGACRPRIHRPPRPRRRGAPRH